jgi:hypothetical protein
MKTLVLASSIFFVGCGDCIPSSAVNASSVALDGPPARALAVTHSPDELGAALAGKWVKEQLDGFVAATNFATTDVALIRAGGERARLAGQTVDGARVTLYFTGMCSPCPGGNGASYQEAQLGYNAAYTERTEVVRIPKGAHVDVRVCAKTCERCPTNVP